MWRPLLFLAVGALAFGLNDSPTLVYCLDLFAYSAAARGDSRTAVLVLAATEAARERIEVGPDEDEQAIRTPALALVGAVALDEMRAEGRALELADAVSVARSSRIVEEAHAR